MNLQTQKKNAPVILPKPPAPHTSSTPTEPPPQSPVPPSSTPKPQSPPSPAPHPPQPSSFSPSHPPIPASWPSSSSSSRPSATPAQRLPDPAPPATSAPPPATISPPFETHRRPAIPADCGRPADCRRQSASPNRCLAAQRRGTKPRPVCPTETGRKAFSPFCRGNPARGGCGYSRNIASTTGIPAAMCQWQSCFRCGKTRAVWTGSG